MEVDPVFCRVCFTQEESEEYTEITSSSCQVELLSVGNIEVFEGDPNMICKRCRLILSNSYKFKQICKRSENLLKTYPITKKIPGKIEIAQESLASAEVITKENEPGKPIEKEMVSVCVGNEIELKESSTQTEEISEEKQKPVDIEQMEMIIASEYESEIPCIIAPPTLFEDGGEPQICIVNEDEESRKPKILSNEPVKILNKSPMSVTSAAPKQFKKTSGVKTDKGVQDTKPKILNSQLKMPQLKTSSIIESIEETPDGNIEIITYGNEEYLEEEEQLLEEKKQVVDDKSEDGVVYTCEVCDRSFPLLQQLEIHKQNHKRARNFPCEYCEKAFFTKYDLAKHMFTHTKQKDYTCVVCKKSFSRSTLLYRHEKIHTDPNIPRYQCEHCDRVYLNVLDYSKHQATHSKNRPFACSYCDKRFAFKQGLERHEVVHDSKSMLYKCQYCPERFKTAARLQRHLSSSHAGTRAFPCSKCSKRFMLSHHLSRHMRTSHQNENEDITIQCPECEENITHRDIFFDHCLQHAIASLICPMCRYESTDLDDINSHVLLHSKSDMYFCDYCASIFMSQEVLNEHFIEKHSEELCAIGEEEIEFVVEKKPTIEKETAPKRGREKLDTAAASKSKRFKQQSLDNFTQSTLNTASFVEFEEEIVEPMKTEKPNSSPISVKNLNKEENVPKMSNNKATRTTTTTTIQRVKMTQSEIQKLQREGKIIVQDGMLIMKQ